ncbi:MAG: hypothetical protein A2X41_08005 [Candidatus Margulisbacteria bacterium GWE2_39_32]|nr:MAG: hypothetical protein A2X41_08005 [Candidatus Margulisbacteria bacterium GWE2_39_32]
MKVRVLATTLIGLVAASSAFAGELSVKGTYTDLLATGGKNVAQKYTYGKGRINFKLKANDQTAFVVENKLESAMAIDYVYADIAMFDSKLRIGTVTDGTAGFSGGIYQSPVFQALTRTKDNGVAYYTKFDNYNISLVNMTALVDGNQKKVYAAKVDTKIDNLTLGGIVKYAGQKNTAGDDVSGLATEFEASYKIGDAKLSGQYYMDLSDKAARIFDYKGKAGVNNTTYKKESFLGLFGEYSLAGVTGVSGLGVYADYIMAMNNDTKTQWVNTTKAEQGGLAGGTQSRLAIGGKLDINSVSTLFAEVVSATPKSGDVVGSSYIGAQVKF